MNLELSDWDQDLPAEEYEEYENLITALKRKEGFGLFFVQCSNQEAEQLINKISHFLPEKNIQVLRLTEPIDTLYDQLLDIYTNKRFDILLIAGLEYSLYKYEKQQFGEITETHYSDLSSVPPILDHLNQKRELIRDKIPVIFVFLGHPFVIDYFIHRSQDFFDWKSSSVLKLTTIPELVQEQSSSISSSEAFSSC
ncbi:hypothetical protein VB713_13745 [Anabaena cylindrica UHCC 0172]|uniref:hypothetical protein n=1 Tax=Anabaena cylindrica TaxID=1165 RepID=UPI002B218F1E|nr:hypothetical protein [Anabaena cylindrica]MEA5552008.1 hypothetical protein [Anabaena cylindrica UHCC 0172]